MKKDAQEPLTGDVLAPDDVIPDHRSHQVELRDLQEETQKHAILIGENWRRVATSIIETGQAITAARRSLKKDPLELDRFDGYLRTRLGISTSERSKLEQIGAKLIFRQEENSEKLPRAVATLYELTRLPDKKLQDALESNAVSPSTTQAQVKKMRLPPKAKKSKPTLTVSISGKPKNIPDEKLTALKALLNEFQEFIDVKRRGL